MPMKMVTRGVVVGCAMMSGFPAVSRAQCYGDPSPRSVQDAIEAAPPGGVVFLEGLSNYNEPICIDKPLTLVGPAQLECGLGSSSCEGVVNIGGSVDGAVILSGITVRGWKEHNPIFVRSGIHCASGSATVVLDSCRVLGADYGVGTGDAGSGAPGICGSVELLVVRDSLVRGGHAEPGLPAYYGLGGDGGDGIRVSGEVLLVRSTCAGGDAGHSKAHPDCNSKSYYPPGEAGDAVSADSLYAWGSAGSGGSAGGFFDCEGEIVSWGAAGADLPANPPATLQVTQEGNSAKLAFEGGVQALWISLTGWHPSVVLPGYGVHFLGGAPLLVLQSALPLTELQFSLPSIPSLVGTVWVLQSSGGNPDHLLLLGG